MQSDILRQKFLDFFKAKKHKIIKSDSLVPKDDPTILFTPAGMNQFKKEFLGHISGFRRAATAQRCLRTDDLDKVGKTPGHHTFFEMLGNFSFGDYFKEEAIAYAWEFLTEELKIARSKLWVSIYKEDDEAYKIWKDKIKVPENKIIKLGDKENFWPSEAKEKGPNGPCGPCSEIFFDQGNTVGCARADCNPSCNCGRFVEVWNLVFTQFNRKEGGILESLPKKNIDTGMGLERLAAVMQGCESNFETDLFTPILKEIKLAIILHPVNEQELIYAIADHIRAITFAIYDGILPSNEKRGYVVKKLIRISTSYIKKLGIKPPFLYKLVPVVSSIMKKPYPDLDLRKEDIAQIILSCENKLISIQKSIPKLIIANFQLLRENQQKADEKAFELYDTYGLDLEEIEKIFEKDNIKFSKEGFLREMEKQRLRSRTQSAMKGDVFDIKILHLGGKKTNFLGYAKYETKAKIIKIIEDDAPIKKITKGKESKIILDKTVFYPESGGQIGDTGAFIKGKNIFQVTDTQKFDKVIVHIGIVKEGSFKAGDELRACVDIKRRLSIARNHTATHLLQAALRKVLGVHVQQQGSLVAEDRLRFDFTHFKALNGEQLNRTEEIVNEYIMNNECLSIKEMPQAAAKKSGALAFFGEKYEGRVRVVSIAGFSKELCAGTHLDSTGQIGYFKIIQEGPVASGIRRIEAVTGTGAYKIVKEEEEIINSVASVLGVPKDKIIQELDKRQAKLRELEKRLSAQILDIAKSNIDVLVERAQIVNGAKVITSVLEDLNMDLLRKNVDLIKEKTSNALIALGSRHQGRALLVMGITEDLCQRGLDASKLIREVAGFIGGSGGGRKDFAQAGGNKPENLEEAFGELKNIINQIKL